MRRALQDSGTLDAVIATDHAPHSHNKDVEFQATAVRSVGRGRTMRLTLTHLVHGGGTCAAVIEKLSVDPHRVLVTAEIRIHEGEPANLTISHPRRNGYGDQQSSSSKIPRQRLLRRMWKSDIASNKWNSKWNG